MAARKTPTKKAPAKKAAAPKTKVAAKAKAAVKPAPAAKKVKAVQERFTKTQILTQIAENTDLSRKQVQGVLDELSDIIEGHIKKRSVGEFVLPGLMKISAIKKPARRARKNVPNPFKPGETMDVAAKPASVQVKVRPLKKLKDMTL